MRITVEEACYRLKRGEPVALPTETVYGLAAPLSHEGAIATIFALKKRPSDNPLIIHVEGWDDAVTYCKAPLSESASRLTDAFWPGPLTLVLPIQESLVPALVRGGLATAAFRMPSHPLTLAVIREVGPLVMPSANLSGRPSSTTPSHVEEDFGASFPVVDGGECLAGVESTVVACQGARWEILRLGALDSAKLSTILDYAPVYCEVMTAPICPGRHHRHYAPRARLLMEVPPPPGGTVVGFRDRRYPEGCKLFSMGDSGDPDAVAARLYSILRALDTAGVETAWVDMNFPRRGLWLTIAERLERAAAQN